MNKYIISLLFPVLLFPAVRGQDSAFLNNGVKHETREIDLAKISLESTEIIFSLNRELRQVVSDKELQELLEITTTTVMEIDSLFNIRPDNYLELQNIRSIRNHINFWKLKYAEIDAVDSRISEINKELDKSRLKHARELASWNEIMQIASEYGYEAAAMGRIKQVIGLLDSTILIMAKKSNSTLSMLDMTNECKVGINERIDYYVNLLNDKQKNIFRSSYPSFLELEYGNLAFWKVNESFRVMHKGEFKAFWVYFGKNIGTVLIHILLLAVAILVLVYLKKIGIPDVEYEDVNYRRSLKIILSNPINSALILVLFAATVLYSNKPVLFLELFKLIVSVPLAITLINMAHRKYWSIIIAFEFLVILQLINANLPASLVPARLLLLLTAFMEIFTLLVFIKKIRKATWRLQTLQKIVMTLCYIHLGLAIVAVFTNLTGKVLLTKSLLNAVSGTALATTLIFLAMLVGNGLMMIFLDSRFSDYIHLVRKRRMLMKQKVTRIFQVLAGIFMIYYIMEAYGIDLYIYEWLQRFFQKDRILGSLTFTWGKVAIFFLVIWLSVFISKIIRIVLEEEVLDRMGMSKGLPNTIALLVKYTLVAAGFLAAVSMAGFKMTNLTIILGALSVGIGFGLQNIFNNIVSGLILLLERPIKIGDTIEVGTLIGVVKSIGIRASNVHTQDGAEIIVPNGHLVSNEVINWTLTDKRRRIEVLIGVAYGTDPYKVQEIFLKILADHPEVVKDPSPNVLFNNFDDSSLDFRLLFWTDNFDEWIRIRSEIIFKIYDALKEAGIEMPLPQPDVPLRTPDASPPKAE